MLIQDRLDYFMSQLLAMFATANGQRRVKPAEFLPWREIVGTPEQANAMFEELLKRATPTPEDKE